MISPVETQMLPRQAEVSNVAVEMTAEEKRRHALMILDAVKRDITSERLPAAIEKLIKAYERVGQNEHVILDENITDNILKLKDIAEEKLHKIQDGRSIMGKLKNMGDRIPVLCGWASHKFQQARMANAVRTPSISSDGHFQPPCSQQQAWQEHAPLREEVAAAVVQVVNSSLQPSADFELENGDRVSQVVSLKRSVNYTLEPALAMYHEAFGAADNFDRVCHSAFGFSFYSEEFDSFCMLMADTDQERSSTQLERFLRTVESASKREHMSQMSQDQKLRNQFSQLKKFVLKDHLYKFIALVFVNKILDAIPVNYKQRSTELYLESLKLACDVYLRTQLTEPLPNRVLREGIQNLMKNLYLIEVCK